MGGNSLLDPQFDCKPLGVPRGSFGTMEIVQNDQYIAISVRVFPRPGLSCHLHRWTPASADLDTSYLGHSVGHWDGDTLVVDVAGLNDDTLAGPKPVGQSATHRDP